jgi:hypothetical protein
LSAKAHVDGTRHVHVPASLRNYVPARVTAATWALVRAIVQESIAAAASSDSAAQRYRPHVAAFAGWAHGQGVACDLVSMFDLDLIERYIETGMPGAAEGSRSTRRAVLRRVARRASPALRDLPRPTPFAYRRIRAPYTAGDVARYLRLAAQQPTPGRRQSVQAVLRLGLGCGLDGRDMSWVRGTDVHQATDGAVTVSVSGGTRPRDVVALRAHESPLIDLAEGGGERLLIGGTSLGRHNVTSVALQRLIGDASLPRLVVTRLRSTWLVEHLRAGTPLMVLMPAAGLTTTRPLEDLLPFLPPAEDDELPRWLRGAG